MATPINAPMAGEIWHLSIEDLFQPLQEAPRLGGDGPFVINLSASTAPISIPTEPFAGCSEAYVYQIQVTEDGRTRYRLRLGPFASEDEADAVLIEVRDTYPGALTATAGAADLRVIATKAAKADARPQRPARTQAPLEVPSVKPVPEQTTTTKPAADAANMDAAESEISIDIAWSTPAQVVPPPVPLSSVPIAATAAPAVAPQQGASGVAPKPAPPTIVPQSAAAMARKPPARAAAPKQTAAVAPPKVAPPTIAVQPAAPAATLKPAQTAAPMPMMTPVLNAIEPAPMPMAAPVLTEEVTVKPKAMPTPMPVQKTGHAMSQSAPVQTAVPPIKAPTTPPIRMAPPAVSQPTPAQTAVPPIKAPADKAATPPRQSVALGAKPAAPFRSQVFRPLAARLTSLQPVVVATAPAPAVREVKKLDQPLESLESTQTMRALTATELEDDEERWFVIQLASADRAFDPDTVPNLDIFSEYRLYSVAGNDQGHIVHALRLGFFREEIGAVAVASYLGAYWDKPTIKRVSLAERERFGDQRVEARKDVGATGRHAVIEITDELVARRRRAGQSSAPAPRNT